MVKIKSHIFRGLRYKIKWRPITKAEQKKMKYTQTLLGSCDGPSSAGKTITIDPTTHGSEFLKVVIDEAIHACIWDLDNVAVDETSSSIASFLWKIGFRNVEM